jgi:hypothetical protein
LFGDEVSCAFSFVTDVQAEVLMREMITQGRTTIDHLVQHALDYYSIMPDFNRKAKEATLKRVANTLIQQVRGGGDFACTGSRIEINHAGNSVH